MFTRRHLIISLPALALAGAGLAWFGYRNGGCPLSNDGYCVGPCSAFFDHDGDGLCDRLSSRIPQQAMAIEEPLTEQAPASLEPSVTATSEQQASTVLDATQQDDGPRRQRRRGQSPADGETTTSARDDAGDTAIKSETSSPDMATDERATAEPSPTATAQPSPTVTPAPAKPAPQSPVLVLCPFGLVNDPYPGRCRRYVDSNNNGYCDLSESGS